MTAIANLTNITSIEDFIRYDNSLTGDMYIPMVLFSIFFIVLFSLGAYEKTKAFAVASFTTTIVALLFWIMGLLSFIVLGFLLGLTILSLLLLVYG